MLHIHNGDSTAGTLKEFGFPGEHKAFQEVLMEGPTAGSLSPDEFLQTRARFLAEAYELKLDKAERDLREQESWLRESSEHDETILWFEHDLFCQVNLIYLLDWFSQHSIGARKLSLICIDEFVGVDDFRGLGQLSGEQLASLFQDRHEVSESELSLAAKAWAAYRSPNPEDVLRLIEGDTSAMPFLEHALRRHLSRFPSRINGLGRIERKALDLTSKGVIAFKSLFPKFASDEPDYGLGDLQFWSVLQLLGSAKEPLMRVSGLDVNKTGIKSINYLNASLELTEVGRAVLAGERDFVEVNGIDRWLGGVHLVGGRVWRWDDDRGTLTIQ
jgi:Domain of unknown function (DUF1835)